MTQSFAPYMQWAKSRPQVETDLALSNVMACSAADLGDAGGAVDFSGHNDNGYPPLLDAIAARYGVTADRVATAIGTSGANFLVGLALIERGCEVLVERPAYDPLLGIPRALGATIIRFERRFEDRYAIDPDAVRRAMTPATKLVVLTQPHNPSSGLTPDETIAAIARDAARHGAYVLVDEVYLDASRGCGARPAALLADNIISTNSLTKSYGLAPLRCGWAIAAPEIAERIRRARDVVDGTGSLPVERLSVLAFEQLERLATRARRLISPNVDVLARFLERTPALQGFVEHGTVAFPRLASGAEADGLAAKLMRDFQTAVVPGRFFEAPSHLRIGLAIPTAVLQRGLHNLSSAL